MSKTATYKKFIPFTKMEENVEVNNQEANAIPPATPVQDCSAKIVFINGSVENEEAASNINNMLKEKVAGCDIKEINLYELNIQPLSQKDPKDGMSQIYQAIECSDIVVFTLDSSKSDESTIDIVIKRIEDKYKENQGLQFKCFSAIIIGEDDKMKNDMLNLAYSLGMIVTPQAIISTTADAQSADIMTQIDLAGIKLTQIAAKTSDLRTHEITAPQSNADEDENKEDESSDVTNPDDSNDSDVNSNDSDVDSFEDFTSKMLSTSEEPIDTTTDDVTPGTTDATLEEGEDEDTDDTDNSEEEENTDAEYEEVFSFEEWKKRNKPVTESNNVGDILSNYISLFDKKYFASNDESEIL